MFDKPTSLHTIGVEREGPTLRAAQLTLKRNQPALEKLSEISLTELGELNEALKRDLVVSVLETAQLLVRPLEIKLKKARDVDAVLAFQAEPLLPYSIENALLDKIVLETTPEGSQLTLLAARKDHLQQHLASWEELQDRTRSGLSVFQLLLHFLVSNLVRRISRTLSCIWE